MQVSEIPAIVACVYLDRPDLHDTLVVLLRAAQNPSYMDYGICMAGEEQFASQPFVSLWLEERATRDHVTCT